MTQGPVDSRMPLLLVGHGVRSAPTFHIAEAASGLCDILWLIDETVGDNATTARLLRKLGAVVDTAGLSSKDTVAAVRAHSPDAVVTYRDDDIVLLSLIAADLGLDYHTPEVAWNLVDKFLQRETLRSAGVPSPLCWQVPAGRDPAAVEALAALVEFPAVLKPRSGSGSQYTMPVSDAGDLVRQLALLPPQAGATRGMMVEQYIPGLPKSERFGDYVSVESLVAGGRIAHLAVTGRFPLAKPFRETGFFIPADLSATQQEAVLEVATAALSALGVRTGGFHTEIKLSPEGPRVLEVNGRLGGGVHDMLLQASGESIMRLLTRVALGQAVELDGPIPCSEVGWRFLFQTAEPGRRTVSVEGLDRLAELPGVNSVVVNRAPGDTINSWDGTRQYLYEVRGVSPDYEGLLEIDRFLHEDITVVYE